MTKVIINGRRGQKLVADVYSGLNKDHESLGYKLASLEFYLRNIHDVQNIREYHDYIPSGTMGEEKGCRMIALDAHNSAMLKQKKSARSLSITIDLIGGNRH